jgi:hypothetical protein
MNARALLISIAFCALGCSAEGDGDSGANEASSGGQSCDPGLISECTCTDGSMSTQTCMPDGSGYSECECGGGTTTSSSTSAGSMATTTTGMSAGSEDTAGASTDAGSGDTSAADGSSSSEGPPPECNGSHPLVEGDLRYCERGHCYCGDLEAMPPVDVCYAMEIAEACCPDGIELVCY